MKKREPRLTRFEMEIMEAFWTLGGPRSVREIMEGLSEKKRPAYTTVQTIVRRLEEKGAVRRVRKIGNAHLFEATLTRKAARGNLVTELLDFLGGSARPLMAHLVETGRISLDDLREVEILLKKESDNEPSDATKRTRKRRSA